MSFKTNRQRKWFFARRGDIRKKKQMKYPPFTAMNFRTQESISENAKLIIDFRITGINLGVQYHIGKTTITISKNILIPEPPQLEFVHSGIRFNIKINIKEIYVFFSEEIELCKKE